MEFGIGIFAKFLPGALYEGGIIIYEDGGPSICDELSPVFSGLPSLTVVKKTGPPPYEWEKNRAPLSDKIKKHSGPPFSELKTAILPHK